MSSAPSEFEFQSDCDLKGRRQSSMFYGILPAVLQSRLSRIKPLRSSAGECPSRDESFAQTSDEYILHSSSHSPSASYSSRSSSQERSLATRPERFFDRTESDYPSRPLSSASTLTVSSATDNLGQINWKYARQGYYLMSQALSESSAVMTGSRSASALCRQLYIHSLTYLLRALPPELEVEEAVSINAALPPTLVAFGGAPGTREGGASGGTAQGARHGESDDQPSLLQETIASCIVQTCLLVHLLLPYVQLLFASLYQYERKHQISERMFSQGVNIAEGLGRRGLLVTEKVYAIGDGKFGKAINEAAVWWVKGVSGGIYQGIHEGVLAIKAETEGEGLPPSERSPLRR